MDPTQLKYAGEAIFLLGVAYRLLRWALGAFEEGDAPPSAFNSSEGIAPTNLATLLTTPVSQLSPTGLNPGGAQLSPTTFFTFKSSSPSLVAKFTSSATQAQGLGEVPLAGLFPQSMLDAMTPEQRAMVQATLASGLHVQAAQHIGPMTSVTFSTSPTVQTSPGTSKSPSLDPNRPLSAVDPALLQSMLAALSPDHRAQVLAMLAKQQDAAVKRAS
jgi:hypothetical protein